MYRNLFHCLKFLRIKIVRNFDARHEGGRGRWIFELDTNLVY